MICVRWPRDGGEALIIFSDKKVHAGPECAVPLLGLREETVRKELELNRRGEARHSDELDTIDARRIGCRVLCLQWGGGERSSRKLQNILRVRVNAHRKLRCAWVRSQAKNAFAR